AGSSSSRSGFRNRSPPGFWSLAAGSARGSCPDAELCPLDHQTLALLQEVAAPIGRFDLVRDDMSERRFGDFTLVLRLLADPVPKRRAETVNRVRLLHFLEELGQGHVR